MVLLMNLNTHDVIRRNFNKLFFFFFASSMSSLSVSHSLILAAKTAAKQLLSSCLVSSFALINGFKGHWSLFARSVVSWEFDFDAHPFYQCLQDFCLLVHVTKWCKLSLWSCRLHCLQTSCYSHFSITSVTQQCYQSNQIYSSSSTL